MTTFSADTRTLPKVKNKLQWAARHKLIRGFTCTATPDPDAEIVTIEWWDQIDQPVYFSRAHDKGGTASA